MFKHISHLSHEILFIQAVLHLQNDIHQNRLDETTLTDLPPSTSFKYFAANGNTLFAISELPINTNNGLFDRDERNRIERMNCRNADDSTSLSRSIRKEYLDIEFSF